MDLGISEPIDFSSGDHQQLVRKTADHKTKSKSGHRTSPSSEPKISRGHPHSKTSSQGDSYVVEISEETTQDDNNAAAGPFSDSSVRRGENKEIPFWKRKANVLLKCFHRMDCQKDLIYF